MCCYGRGIRAHRGDVAVAGNTGKAVPGVGSMNMVLLLMLVVLGPAFDSTISGHIAYKKGRKESVDKKNCTS